MPSSRPAAEAAGSTGDGSAPRTAGTAQHLGRGRTPATAEKEGAFGSSGFPLLTVTMENGAAEEAPRAIWLGRVAAVLEARGDRDEAVRLYGEAAAALTGGNGSCHTGALVGGTNCGRRDDGGNARIHPAARGNGTDLSPLVGGVEAGLSAVRIGGGSGGGGSGGGVRNLFPYSARAHYLASMIERSYRRHFNR